jgi:hypothetical protein
MSDDILSAIDQAVDAAREDICGCGCGATLHAGSPSLYYATQDCQKRTLRQRTTNPDEVELRPDYTAYYDSPWRHSNPPSTHTPAGTARASDAALRGDITRLRELLESLRHQGGLGASPAATYEFSQDFESLPADDEIHFEPYRIGGRRRDHPASPDSYHRPRRHEYHHSPGRAIDWLALPVLRNQSWAATFMALYGIPLHEPTEEPEPAPLNPAQLRAAVDNAADESELEDPRARALWLRRNRNTGPKTNGGRSPRSIEPRRMR